MKIDETLSDVFDIQTIKETATEVVPAANSDSRPRAIQDIEKIETDYDHGRANLHDLLEKGKEALTSALEIAKQSEHPRAFEVVGNLMKQLADINEQLLTLHMKKQKLDAPVSKEDGQTTKQVTNNNAIFVGSTSDLSKMIHNMTKGE